MSTIAEGDMIRTGRYEPGFLSRTFKLPHLVKPESIKFQGVFIDFIVEMDVVKGDGQYCASGDGGTIREREVLHHKTPNSN